MLEKYDGGEEVRKLILDNPELPVLFFATDEANYGDYTSQLASGSAQKGIVLDCDGIKSDHIYTDEDDLEQDIEEYLYEVYKEKWSEQKLEQAVKEEMKKYAPYWKECIMVTVDCL